MKTNELLRRYVDDRSEAAFEELVKQHIDLVYSSALRQMNGDAAAAQDVTQAVFTALARKAPRLTHHASLTGWLYTSTRYLAANALRTDYRRHTYEQKAHEMNQLLRPTELDAAWQELRPLLDEAMHDLSATDREAVLLRYFERLPLAEIGARTGLKENAVQKRIERAVGRLRVALAKRGVTSATAALTAVLPGRVVGAAPSGLAGQVSRTAFATVTGTGGLTWSILKLVGLMKGKTLVIAGGAALVTALVVVPPWMAQRNGTAAATGATGPAHDQAAARVVPSLVAMGGANTQASATQSAQGDGLMLHVVDSDTGKPIANAKIEFMVAEKGAPREPLIPMTMNAAEQGECEVPIRCDATDLLIIRSRIDGFVDTTVSWSPARGEKLPAQFTIRLPRSTPVGGQVVDEDGKPVAGADVEIQTTGSAAAEENRNPPHISTMAGEKTTTGANGRWRIDRFAKADVATLSLTS